MTIHVDREHDGLEFSFTGRAVELASARRYSDDRGRVPLRFIPFIRDMQKNTDPFYRCGFCNLGDTSRLHVAKHLVECHSERLPTSHKL